MNLLSLFGWLAVLITAVGSYRLTTYLYRRDPLYSMLTGAALALLLIVFFEAVLLATGVLTVLLPIWYVLDDQALQLTIPHPNFDGWRDRPSGVAAWGRRRGEEVREWIARVNMDWLPIVDTDDEPAIQCPRCARPINHGDRFCPSCGLGIRWQTGGDQG